MLHWLVPLAALSLPTSLLAGEVAQTLTPAADASYYPQWLAEAPQAPRFQVRDTVNKYGRYARETKTVTLEDLIKFHGHFCGGLVESAGALRVLFDRLFPDGVIDRTDLRVASNNSACGGDVVAYLSGARTRFGSHLIDTALKESVFVVQRLSSGQTLKVRVNPAVYPTTVREQMRKIEVGGFEPADIDLKWTPNPGQVAKLRVEGTMSADRSLRPCPNHASATVPTSRPEWPWRRSAG